MKRSNYISVTALLPLFFFLLLELVPFNFGTVVNIFYLTPGGASAHSYRQPKEAGSSALLRP